MSWVRKRVLLAVKAYPTTSRKYGATYCAAGVTDDGEWIRMYPMSFHHYIKQRLPRYSWIELECKKDTSEKLQRKESYKVREETITVVDDSYTSYSGRKDYWSSRNRLLLPLASESVEDLKAQQGADKTSLGLIRPRYVTDFVIQSPADDGETVLFQTDLEGNAVPTPNPPPTAKYQFRCTDECPGHEMVCLDWELGQAWRKWKKQYLDESSVAEKVREKFFAHMVEKTDLRFFMGTDSQWGRWMIIGLYYPPLGAK